MQNIFEIFIIEMTFYQLYCYTFSPWEKNVPSTCNWWIYMPWCTRVFKIISTIHRNKGLSVHPLPNKLSNYSRICRGENLFAWLLNFFFIQVCLKKVLKFRAYKIQLPLQLVHDLFPTLIVVGNIETTYSHKIYYYLFLVMHKICQVIY